MADLAALTNAILVATLPYFDDFARKLQLPVRTLIRQEDLVRFHVDPQDVRCDIALRSGAEPWFKDGHVDGFRLPSSYYSLQDPDLVPRCYGTFKLSREECQRIVVQAVEKLGYTNLFAQLPPPKVRSPPPDFGHDEILEQETGLFQPPVVSLEMDAVAGEIKFLNLNAVKAPEAPDPKPSIRAGDGATAH